MKVVFLEGRLSTVIMMLILIKIDDDYNDDDISYNYTYAKN